MATLRKLLRMVEEKQRLVRLLDAYMDGPGLAVVIGTEHTDPDLRACSVVASTSIDGRAGRRRHDRADPDEILARDQRPWTSRPLVVSRYSARRQLAARRGRTNRHD